MRDCRGLNDRRVNIGVFPQGWFTWGFVILMVREFFEDRRWALFGHLWTLFEWYLTALLIIVCIDIISILNMFEIGVGFWGVSWDVLMLFLPEESEHLLKSLFMSGFPLECRMNVFGLLGKRL